MESPTSRIRIGANHLRAAYKRKDVPHLIFSWGLRGFCLGKMQDTPIISRKMPRILQFFPILCGRLYAGTKVGKRMLANFNQNFKVPIFIFWVELLK